VPRKISCGSVEEEVFISQTVVVGYESLNFAVDPFRFCIYCSVLKVIENLVFGACSAFL
jgi:hypothetical protein